MQSNNMNCFNITIIRPFVPTSDNVAKKLILCCFLSTKRAIPPQYSCADYLSSAPATTTSRRKKRLTSVYKPSHKPFSTLGKRASVPLDSLRNSAISARILPISLLIFHKKPNMMSPKIITAIPILNSRSNYLSSAIIRQQQQFRAAKSG